MPADSTTPAAPDAPDAKTATDSREPAFRYTARLANDIELRWQAKWEEEQTFRTPNPGDPDFDATRPKFFCMDMFPYPSGAGLHVGHPEGYTATDILCRYRRMRGYNVLHPMGWDAFGLPAEQYAIQTGVHPAITTRTAIDNFRRQLKRFGFCYDWSREFATIDEDYYKWTQWIWVQAYNSWYDTDGGRAAPMSELVEALARGAKAIGPEDEIVDAGTRDARSWSDLTAAEQRGVIDNQRLAYLAEQTVNWCPKLGTVLANEEVIDGRSERGSFPVHRRPLRQWMFRITAFADRLLDDLETLDWPDSTRIMQREWIGRSEGAEVDFPMAAPLGGHERIRVYTTRPDTIFGATFMVLAPEHPLVDEMLSTPSDETDAAALAAYVKASRDRSDVDRLADSRDKTGVFTGYYAINPATGEQVPIWTADYVLMGYGHGAIMAVPAHDDRDYEFATTFGLDIRDVVHSTVMAAVHAFCVRHHAAGGETSPERAYDLLVDFVGLCVNQSRTDYDAVWSITSSPRSDDNRESTADDGPGDRRGSIAVIWWDALQDLVTNGMDELVEAAVSGRVSMYLGHATPEPGTAVNSSNDGVNLDGLGTEAAKAAIIDWLESERLGRRKVNYKLRDWLFSRQRYWGEPFPVVYDADGNHYAVEASALPVVLPELDDYKPVESDDPSPLLAKAADWVNTTAGEAGVSPDLLPPDTPVRRETNTMPGWAGSCWYYLRYCDPTNSERFISREAERYWMLSSKVEGHDADQYGTFMPDIHHLGGVDQYIGGAEHAVLHLLYARFWHKILFDLGEVSTPEPFGRLFHQGLITSFAYQRADKTLVPTDEVDEPSEGSYVERATGEKVVQVVAKMSKSLKNVVNPDDVIAEFGADTFRLYEMYMGPLDASKPWNTRDIVGPFRFLQRVWRLIVDETTGDLKLATTASPNVEKSLHRTIDKVGQDIDRLAFNTAIAAMIEFVNVATKDGITADQAARFALILAPCAPHLAEEIWSRLGNESTLANEAWPSVDEAMLRDDEIEVPVQILGKVRARVMVPADADDAAIESIAMADPKIVEQLEGKTVRKVIVVKGRIVNIVAN